MGRRHIWNHAPGACRALIVLDTVRSAKLPVRHAGRNWVGLAGAKPETRFPQKTGLLVHGATPFQRHSRGKSTQRWPGNTGGQRSWCFLARVVQFSLYGLLIRPEHGLVEQVEDEYDAAS